MSDPYYMLSDSEWSWVELYIDGAGERGATALRGYLNDRITERLTAARADERAQILQDIDPTHETEVKFLAGLRYAARIIRSRGVR